MPADRRPPWEKPAPMSRGGAGGKLTTAQIDAARARAEQAGRRYPNLVDNMWAMKQPKDGGTNATSDDGEVDRSLDEVDRLDREIDRQASIKNR